MAVNPVNVFVIIMFCVIAAVLLFMAFSPRHREPNPLEEKALDTQ